MPLRTNYDYVKRRQVKGGYQNLFIKKDGSPHVVAISTHIKGRKTKEKTVKR